MHIHVIIYLHGLLLVHVCVCVLMHYTFIQLVTEYNNVIYSQVYTLCGNK